MYKTKGFKLIQNNNTCRKIFINFFNKQILSLFICDLFNT